jgi:hypothetical protein
VLLTLLLLLLSRQSKQQQLRLQLLQGQQVLQLQKKLWMQQRHPQRAYTQT